MAPARIGPNRKSHSPTSRRSGVDVQPLPGQDGDGLAGRLPYGQQDGGDDELRPGLLADQCQLHAAAEQVRQPARHGGRGQAGEQVARAGGDAQRRLGRFEREVGVRHREDRDNVLGRFDRGNGVRDQLPILHTETSRAAARAVERLRKTATKDKRLVEEYGQLPISSRMFQIRRNAIGISSRSEPVV